MIEPQKYLTAQGEKYFYQIVFLCESSDLDLMPADSFMLSVLAQSMDMYNRALDAINEEGYYQTAPNGKWKQLNPHFTVLKSCEQAINQLSRKFGISPSDRAKLMAEMPSKPKNFPDISGGRDEFANI